MKHSKPTLSRSLFLSRIARSAFIFVCVFGTSGLVAGSAQAQESMPITPPAPPDVQKVMNGIGDLDLLKALIPLKITAEQRDALLPLMKQYVTEAGVAQRKADYEGLRALAPSVTKARDAALNGETISPEAEAEMLKFVNASEDRLRAARKKAVDALYPVARQLFTDDQKSEVERQVSRMLGGRRPVPAQYAKDPAKAPKSAVQDLALSTYLDRIFLLDRTATLLAKLKPAPKPEPAETPSEKPADAPAATPTGNETTRP